ncbi:uncharacterized protein LOC122569265 isoform X2 [Bombus pyrosoma]|uniref:uncharacterized protein LOC122569265 isoform X2 n=1 Tax=Bombus pyrosoma TaxID=396416 RepID=UPI001CB8A5F6|nr:uncharacterized protein LOC122569265 isoform X2 [Bombus pyrosoma]
MSILDEREDYLKNPYFVKHEYGDFTPFYVTVTICSFIFAFLCILNIGFCWCSRHRNYWQSPHTGNRWIQPLWTVLPHKTPPLDLSEIEPGRLVTQDKQEVLQYHNPKPYGTAPQTQEYMEMQKQACQIEPTRC